MIETTFIEKPRFNRIVRNFNASGDNLILAVNSSIVASPLLFSIQRIKSACAWKIFRLITFCAINICTTSIFTVFFTIQPFYSRQVFLLLRQLFFCSHVISLLNFVWLCSDTFCNRFSRVFNCFMRFYSVLVNGRRISVILPQIRKHGIIRRFSHSHCRRVICVNPHFSSSRLWYRSELNRLFLT